MKRVIALLLTMGMILSLAACGKSNDDKAASKPTKENPVELTMWNIAVESDSNREAYVNAIKKYQDAHPEVKLTWEPTQNEEYKTKIKAAVAANQMPDIFFTWGGGFLREFVEADRVYALDAEYPEFEKDLPRIMLGNHSNDGKIYAVPTNYNFVCMFANMDILKEVGYDKVPATYDELIACCDALVAKGLIPFGASGTEAWCVTEYLEPIIQKSVGSDTLTDMYLGKTPWNNEGVIKAVDNFQSMITKGYFDPEGTALLNDEIKANFAAGKYAFYINGSWNCASFVDIADHVQIAEFPVIDSSKSSLGELIGGPNDALAVAASSKNTEAAAKAAFEIAKNVCQEGYLSGSGLPAWTPDYDTSTLSEMTKTVADIFKNSKKVVLFGDGIQSADNATTYLQYVSQLYASAIDGKAFAENLDKDLKK